MLEDNNQNFQKCSCVKCPSHNKGMKERALGLFCAREKCSCDMRKQTCLCGSCPVAKENKLLGNYYCGTGKR
jgi:hypothetical protein